VHEAKDVRLDTRDKLDKLRVREKSADVTNAQGRCVVSRVAVAEPDHVTAGTNEPVPQLVDRGVEQVPEVFVPARESDKENARSWHREGGCWHVVVLANSQY
jgi:hypothetical protein